MVSGAFTSERVQVLKILSSQAAIALENARLYASLSAANAKLESYNHTHTSEYLEMLLELIRFYREQYPDSAPEIEKYADNEEIEFALQDLPKVLKSMRAGADRKARYCQIPAHLLPPG